MSESGSPSNRPAADERGFLGALIAAARTLLVKTDVQRWESVSKEIPPWDERNRTIADRIPDYSSVVDLGAGAQTLRKHLKPGCRYQPCDIIRSSPDVIHCDFNSGLYPKLPCKYDYVVCSGILEYARRPEDFLGRIGGYGKTILLSYNPRQAGDGVVARLAKGWVNHLRPEEMESLFVASGLEGSVIDSQPNGQVIYELRAKPSKPAGTTAGQVARLLTKENRLPRVAFMTTVHRNVGDEFIREGIRSFLDELLGDYDAYYVNKHELGTLHESLLDEPEILTDKFRDADLIIQAGAPVYWALGSSRCYNVEWAGELWFERIFKLGPGKPILNLGAGACQATEDDLAPLLDDPKVMEFARQAAAACRCTTVRDPLADRFLTAIGVEHELLACPAFHAARRFNAGKPCAPRNLLAVNLMSRAGHFDVKPQDPRQWQSIAGEMVNRLRKDHRLLFVAHDREEAEFMRAFAKDREAVFHSNDFRDYISVYARVKGIVANRVHGAVCVAGFGRPAVIVGNDSRLAIARPMGIPAKDAGEVSTDWIIGSLQDQLSRAEAIYEERIALREETARQYVELIKTSVTSLVAF